MVLPASPPISMSQIKSEFGLGNNLRAYLGCAPGVPTSGWIAQTDLLGKAKATYHYGYPYSYTDTDLGYYYSYVENDMGYSGWYGSGNLDSYYGDNWGGYSDYGYIQLDMSVVNCGDPSAVYNSYATQYFCVDSDKFNSNIHTSGGWAYWNGVGANAIYFTDYDNYYYNATYSWVSAAYYGNEYFMEMY